MSVTSTRDFPKPNENVIAFKIQGGRVTVHAWRAKTRAGADAVTDCGRKPEWNIRTWLWVEYRTLNPPYVNMCKHCWGSWGTAGT